jgi:tetratricopeptide (TPR) repeat protein
LFLKGEELRRAGKYVSATENYFLAVQLDSTFALSWTRLHQVCGWSHKYPVPPEEIRLNMARYSKSLPPKLREFVSAVIKFYEVEENSISAFQDLLLKYGENADLITWMGEALFHENHWFGQPILEAKPHFIKAMEYDPHNMEIKHHLAQLACLEGDTALLRTLLKSVTPDADHWPGYEALRLVTLEGSWTDEDVNKIFIHPNFSIFSIMTLAYNDMVLDKTILLFEDIKEKGNMEWNGPAVETVQSVLSGQYIGLEDILKKENIPLSVVMIYIACTMGERTFEPFAPYYDLIIGNSEGYILEPQLHDMADVIFKTALEGESGSRTAYENFIQKNADNPVWIHFMRNHRSSLLASFNGENELAKIHIDSSIYYARRLPGASLSNIFMVSGLKFLKAEILFREGRYSEALGWYNSVVRIFAEGSGILLPFVTYRRAQCLEKIGHNLEAVRQYDRFIQLFRDCDEPFQHLVRDAAKARENLFKD